MAHCSPRPMSRSGKAYRSVTDKMLAGVCGGLAEHFNVSSTWLRLGFLVGGLFQPPVVLIAYVIAAFAMPHPEGHVRSRRRFRRRGRACEADMPQEPPQPRVSMDDVAYQLDLIEAKVRAMEDRVTSKEYILRRKFEEL